MKDSVTTRGSYADDEVTDPNVVIIHSNQPHNLTTASDQSIVVGQNPTRGQVTLFDSVITSNEVIDEVDSQCYCVVLCGAIYDFFCFR